MTPPPTRPPTRPTGTPANIHRAVRGGCPGSVTVARAHGAGGSVLAGWAPFWRGCPGCRRALVGCPAGSVLAVGRWCDVRVGFWAGEVPEVTRCSGDRRGAGAEGIVGLCSLVVDAWGRLNDTPVMTPSPPPGRAGVPSTRRRVTAEGGLSSPGRVQAARGLRPEPVGRLAAATGEEAALERGELDDASRLVDATLDCVLDSGQHIVVPGAERAVDILPGVDAGIPLSLAAEPLRVSAAVGMLGPTAAR
ncbi:hypothetical protein ABH937_007438 [Kitasatospora sp. GAS1066B]